MSDPYRPPPSALVEPPAPEPDDGQIDTNVGSDIRDVDLALALPSSIRRAPAIGIDGVLGFLGFGALAAVVLPRLGHLGPWVDALPPLMTVAALVGCEAVFGGSPGKLLMGLRVLDLDGGKAPVWRVLVRNGVKLALLPFLVLVMVLPNGRADGRRLWDVAAGTQVIRRPGAK